MTQQEAIEIIVRQGLTHYHMDERETDEDIMAELNRQNSRTKEKEIIIRKQGGVWHVYTIDKVRGKKEWSDDRFDQEEKAWDQFIRMLQRQQDRIHCCGTRQEVEKIMEQEGLVSGAYSIAREPAFSLHGDEYKITMDGPWHLYKFGERDEVEWEETFEEEEEAWGEFLYHIRNEHQDWIEREQKRKEEQKEKERLSALTREQAEEVIRQKGLIQYNMDEDQEEKEGDTVIRECTHWEVYEVTGIGEKNEKKLAKFFQEEEAWGYLVKKLRYYNEQMNLRLRIQEDGESWIRRLIQHTEKGIQGKRAGNSLRSYLYHGGRGGKTNHRPGEVDGLYQRIHNVQQTKHDPHRQAARAS